MDQAKMLESLGGISSDGAGLPCFSPEAPEYPSPPKERLIPFPTWSKRSSRQAERPAGRWASQGTLRYTAGLPLCGHCGTLTPPQDTVMCMLKRKPPGRSGQPWRSSWRRAACVVAGARSEGREAAEALPPPFHFRLRAPPCPGRGGKPRSTFRS